MTLLFYFPTTHPKLSLTMMQRHSECKWLVGSSVEQFWFMFTSASVKGRNTQVYYECRADKSEIYRFGTDVVPTATFNTGLDTVGESVRCGLENETM